LTAVGQVAANDMKKKLLSLLLVAAFPVAACAALGQSPASVASDGATKPSSMHAMAAVPAGQQSTVQLQSVVTQLGVTVNEYSAGGVVFAVTWSGPVMPDLSQILGSYFPQYKAAIQARPTGGLNAPVAVQTGQLVAHAFGHMRAFSGEAYAPALVPAGFNVSTLGAK
jgi:hypothetical protein